MAFMWSYSTTCHGGWIITINKLENNRIQKLNRKINKRLASREAPLMGALSGRWTFAFPSCHAFMTFCLWPKEHCHILGIKSLTFRLVNIHLLLASKPEFSWFCKLNSIGLGWVITIDCIYKGHILDGGPAGNSQCCKLLKYLFGMWWSS